MVPDLDDVRGDVSGGLGVELPFRAVGWVPTARHAIITEAHISWNYTTVLTLVFLAVAVLLEGGDNWRLHDGAPDEHAVEPGNRRSRHAAAKALIIRR